MDEERALAVLLMYWLCSVAVGSPAVAGTEIAADNTVTGMQSAYPCFAMTAVCCLEAACSQYAKR